MITLLTGMAAFATILTIAAPLFDNDKLKARMKSVGQERDKLRANQRAALMSSETKLRDKPKTDLTSQLVEALNLRRIFEAEAHRAISCARPACAANGIW